MPFIVPHTPSICFINLLSLLSLDDSGSEVAHEDDTNIFSVKDLSCIISIILFNKSIRFSSDSFPIGFLQ